MAVKTLELKRDAQVMLVKNVSDTLVNGSVGKVLDFLPPPDAKPQGDDELLPLVEFSTFKGKETLLVSHDEFRAEDSEGKLLARRVQVGSNPCIVQVTHFFADLKCRSHLQIPLALAWAVSIHKAQGQTIQRVKVDLSKVFEKGRGYYKAPFSECENVAADVSPYHPGQSYVALSRAASMEGLQVVGFDARKVKAHPRVVEWSKSLESAS